MRLIINSGGPHAIDEWRAQFRAFAPELEVVGWHEDADPWFPGGKDEAAVLIVEPDIAEYWTFPESQLKAKWELLKGELTGTPPDLGENRKLEL